MAAANHARAHPAQVKVISLGLGRTGTSSLREALEMLNLGPCYHMFAILAADGKDFPTWCKVGEGKGTPQDFDEIFRDYASAVDYPAAMYPAELYAAYPDAKFILTTRDPAKWAKSMKATILRTVEIINAKPVKTELDDAILLWSEKYMKGILIMVVAGKYHGGRLDSNPEQELIDHNERVKGIIPREKLLVYEVGEGWDRLVDFLQVAKPDVPFPHVNDTDSFEETVIRRFDA